MLKQKMSNASELVMVAKSVETLDQRTRGVIDTGCTKMVAGTGWLDNYVGKLSNYDKM